MDRVQEVLYLLNLGGESEEIGFIDNKTLDKSEKIVIGTKTSKNKNQQLDNNEGEKMILSTNKTVQKETVKDSKKTTISDINLELNSDNKKVTEKEIIPNNKMNEQNNAAKFINIDNTPKLETKASINDIQILEESRKVSGINADDVKKSDSIPKENKDTNKLSKFNDQSIAMNGDIITNVEESVEPKISNSVESATKITEPKIESKEEPKIEIIAKNVLNNGEQTKSKKQLEIKFEEEDIDAKDFINLSYEEEDNKK